MTRRTFTDVAVGLMIVAALFLLVRPGSPGVELITKLTDAVNATVRTAADL